MAKKWNLWQELLKSTSKDWKPNYAFRFDAGQGLFWTVVGSDYHTHSSALMKKIFSWEMVENNICLWGASKQNAFFSENMPQKTYSCLECLK